MNNAGNRGSEQQQGHQSRFQASGAGSRTAESSTGVLGGVAEKAQEMASSVASAAGDAWDSTRQGVTQAASAVADTAENAWDEAARFMRRYPMATFGVGFGLGFLMAQLMGGSGMRHYLRGDWAGYPAPSGSGYPFAK